MTEMYKNVHLTNCLTYQGSEHKNNADDHEGLYGSEPVRPGDVAGDAVEDIDEDESKAKRMASRKSDGVVQYVFEIVLLSTTLGIIVFNSSYQSFSFDIPDTGSTPLRTKNSRISSSVSFSDIEFSMSPLS